MPGYENHMVGKRIFEVCPVEKKLLCPYQALAAILDFYRKKRDHIVFEIERYSKPFSNMIIYMCAKWHTSVTKTAYRVLF